MSLKDFAYKLKEDAKENGIQHALSLGANEALMRETMPAVRFFQTPVWDTDADVILILDACRIDLWREVVSEDDPYKWSVGSASPEWINETFADRHRSHWKTTGYITANPFSGKQPNRMNLLDDSVYPLAELDLGYLDEVWRDAWPMDETLATVDPEIVTDRALWAYQRQDELGINTMMVHYMQPHMPFRSKPDWHQGWNGVGVFGEPENNPESKDTWLRVRDGELSLNEVWGAYKDNLRWVLEEVNRWRTETDAEILVTSDHGNAIGEFNQWSHPPRMANPAIRKVPWVRYSGTNKRDIQPTQAPPTEIEYSDDLDAKLNALGYK